MNRGLRNSASVTFAQYVNYANFGVMNLVKNQGSNIMNRVRQVGQGAGELLENQGANLNQAGRGMIKQGGNNSFRAAVGTKLAQAGGAGVNAGQTLANNAGKTGLALGGAAVGGTALAGAGINSAMKKKKPQDQMQSQMY